MLIFLFGGTKEMACSVCSFYRHQRGLLCVRWDDREPVALSRWSKFQRFQIILIEVEAAYNWYEVLLLVKCLRVIISFLSSVRNILLQPDMILSIQLEEEITCWSWSFTRSLCKDTSRWIVVTTCRCDTLVRCQSIILFPFLGEDLSSVRYVYCWYLFIMKSHRKDACPVGT
jgi:hypothetical protein